MIPLEYEIDHLKNTFFEMIDLVRDQMTLTKEALLTGDVDAAADVMRKEGRVNSYELSIDRECEDFLALQAPVATDLRLAIAILKMSSALERIGDHAYKISSFIYEEKVKLKKELINLVELPNLFDEIDKMLENVLNSLEKGDVKSVKLVFKQDKVLDKVYSKAPAFLEKFAKDNKESVSNIIVVSRIVGKLERSGDLITNIAEEIIFYNDTKIIKHRKRNKKIKKMFNLRG